jgi:DNA-binding transcriptional LysR family regulator
MDWDKLRIFHAAAEAGSFTHAGEALRMSQSAVSRQVSALEKELNVALFHRHARGLVLTEQGEMLFGTASEIMNKLSTAETLLSDTTTKPTGDLKITAPVGLGSVWVTQRLREFLELYPDIRIELVLTDEQLAIAMRAADVAIWVSEPQQSELIRRPLFNMKLHAFASTQYVRRHGTPQSIAALDGRPPRKPVFVANNIIALKYAIRAGIGIGLIPDYLTEEETDLVPVLRETQLPTLPIYFVYPEELKTAKKVQVFRDFLVAKARQWQY